MQVGLWLREVMQVCGLGYVLLYMYMAPYPGGLWIFVPLSK